MSVDTESEAKQAVSSLSRRQAAFRYGPNGDLIHPSITAAEGLAFVLNIASQGIVVHDGDVVLFANERAYELLRLPDGMLRPGASVYDWVKHCVDRGDYPEGFPLDLDRMMDRIKQGTQVIDREAVEGRIVRTDARYQDGFVVATYTDVTAERQGDQQAQLLRIVAGAAEQGILVHDGQTVHFVNERANELLATPRNILHVGCDIMRYIDWTIERGSYCDLDEDASHEFRESVRTRAEVHVERRTANGHLRVDARPVGGLVVVTYTDVSDARRREDELTMARARVDELASFDSLTGLANRHTFDQTLRESLDAPSETLALLMTDLDGFKAVNDTYGHATGDKLLKIVAQRMERVVRSGDVLARLGGDEFALVGRFESAKDARLTAERLRSVASRPVSVGDIDLKVGASVGVAFHGPDTATPDALMKASDVALYEAKAAGRDTVVVFSEPMVRRHQERVSFKTNLARAAERGEIVVHYQPQIDLRTQEIKGYEALMRWQRSGEGLLMPGDFIPLAEETGLIVDLGRNVLQQATRDIQRLPGERRISVNVSPVQFLQSDFAADVEAALEESGLPASRLVIEVSERVFCDEEAKIVKTLDALSALGVALSLDDFGSPHSALAYLTRYPFSRIKIARAFTDAMASDQRAGAVGEAVFSLAAALHLTVTAEGVEEAGELLALAASRCDEAQGYLLGKPQPLEGLLADLGNEGAIGRGAMKL